MTDAKPKQQPSVGRVVHYWPDGPEVRGTPWAAIITCVNADDTCNLTVFSNSGYPIPKERAPHGGDAPPGPEGPFCTWTWPAFVPPKP